MYDNVFYYAHVNDIGGVETFFYEIARKYRDFDITMLYKTGDGAQLRRLAEHIRLRRWNGERIQCRRAFFGYSFEALDFIDADEYVQIIHADFKELIKRGWTPRTDPRFTRYVAVSENNARSFEELTGIRPEVFYNPLTLEKPKKLLRLISATRLSGEKGGERMKKLAKALDAAGIAYSWEVYTNSPTDFGSPNVICLPGRLDMQPRIAAADYLVQLSDTEGYSYSMLEALCLGTPIIVTPLPINSELGVENGVNGFVLPFDMSEIPVERIAKGLKRVKHKHSDRWAELLVPGKSTWQEERQARVTVEALQRYLDLELDRIFDKGETHECSRARGEDLENKGLARIVY
ncbi:MAG: glycosyltransferase [Eubacteriales bacterium]|nr:glycosyltransferase [Eubacteriales bacterium]